MLCVNMLVAHAERQYHDCILLSRFCAYAYHEPGIC